VLTSSTATGTGVAGKVLNTASVQPSTRVTTSTPLVSRLTDDIFTSPVATAEISTSPTGILPPIPEATCVRQVSVGVTHAVIVTGACISQVPTITAADGETTIAGRLAVREQILILPKIFPSTPAAVTVAPASTDAGESSSPVPATADTAQ